MWDCRHKVGKDHCRLRKVRCFPGGVLCVLKGKYEFPLRTQKDELEDLQKFHKKKINKG